MSTGVARPDEMSWADRHAESCPFVVISPNGVEFYSPTPEDLVPEYLRIHRTWLHLEVYRRVDLLKTLYDGHDACLIGIIERHHIAIRADRILPLKEWYTYSGFKVGSNLRLYRRADLRSQIAAGRRAIREKEEAKARALAYAASMRPPPAPEPRYCECQWDCNCEF
jgi:hypothetical protein